MLFLLLHHVFSANCNLITNTPRATERRTAAVGRRRKVNHLQVLPPCVWDRDDIPGEREPHCKRHSEQLSWDELKGKIFMSPHATSLLQRSKSLSESSAAGVENCTGVMRAGRGGRAAIHTMHCDWALWNYSFHYQLKVRIKNLISGTIILIKAIMQQM